MTALFVTVGVVAMTALPSNAATTIYDSIPSPLPPNVVSLGYEATSTTEFGDDVFLVGSDRFITNVTVTMSDWALHADYPLLPDPWTHPITLNIYAVDNTNPDPAVGALLCSTTQTFNIPWRPPADPTCPNPTAWRAANANCYNGYAFNITFAANCYVGATTNEVIFGIVYNTADYGPSPIHAPGPYNSLNVGLRDTGVFGPVPTGSDREPDALFWNTSFVGFYTEPCPGGTFCRDTAWAPYTPAIKIEALACATDSQCDDGLFCTIDTCSAGVCTYAARDCATTDDLSIDFENPPYTPLGTINGQDGWSSTGAAGMGCAVYDHALASSLGTAGSGAQSLRISNAVVSGCFGDQTFSKSLPDEVGESTATNNGMSGGTRLTHFESQFSLASAVAGAEQPGLYVSVSADRGDGARMTYLRFEDSPCGINVFFDDYQDAAPFGSPGNEADGCGVGDDFIETQVGTCLTRAPHTFRQTLDTFEGPRNDVVNIYIDGVLVHTGTSWEDYFRWCEATDVSRTVDSLLFRTGGTPGVSNCGCPGSCGNCAGQGFLIDNLTLQSGLGGDACNAGSCDESTDSCILQPANEGGPCPSDGNVCTSDVCASGTCTHQTAPNDYLPLCPDDGDPCTIEFCLQGVCTRDRFCPLPTATPPPGTPTPSTGATATSTTIATATLTPTRPTPTPTPVGPIPTATATPFCGDGHVDPGEQCDDGNRFECDPVHPQKPFNGDTCNNMCMGLICKDPSKITLRPTGLDQWKAHGILVPVSDRRIDFSSGAVSISLNVPLSSAQPRSVVSPDGRTIFATSLPGGAVEARTNGGFRYKNRAAKQTGGIYQLKASPTNDGTLKLTIVSYGDLSAAKAEMVTYITAAGQEWSIHGLWRQTRTGWVFERAIP